MISSIEELYQKILQAGISEEDLERQVKKKVKEFGGYMSEKGVLFIIAKEYGISIQSPEIDPELYHEIENGIDYDEFTVDISNVKEDMQNVVLLGKIYQIFKVKEFLRKDGTPGVVGSFIIGDSSGTIKIVVWDKQAQLIQNEIFKKGEIIRIIGGYSKVNQQDSIEVHLGKRGKLQLSPNDVDAKKKSELENLDFEKIEFRVESSKPRRTIESLVSTFKFIKEIQGIIHIEAFKELIKDDGDKTFLLKLILSDDSASVRVNIWGMNAINILKMINDGDLVKVRDIMVKENTYTNKKELNFTKKSFLEII